MVYLDNIIIYSNTFEQYLDHLQQVFDQLENAGLKLNSDKCSFVKDELEFLGHVISSKGKRTNPAKVQKVKNFPAPTNITQLRGFLGLASYYRQFILNFLRIASPLNKLLKKETEYNWMKFILLTDASTFGLGAILFQLDEQKNNRIIAYASRTCNKVKCNYSATELECLMVVWAVKHFHAYLYGQKFQLIMDHTALCHLFNMVTPTGRLACWIMKLQIRKFERQAHQYIFLEGLLHKKNKKNPTCLLRVLKKNELETVLYSFHKDPLAEHFGFAETYRTINLKYFWPQMGADIKAYVQLCDVCQHQKYP
ncbi:enzymatic polyprotein, putative [Rhizophagus clarus]|uniref:Enzymatic polyprotein, putative n=1 Tax=Rhizophagus clarus TaxID=94130 RepID=A0A8H3QHY8_9GLOM|nr:enzymatic polyprotein, putative [Rhizophagus clarus]